MQTKKRRLKISRILLAVAVCLWVYQRFFFGEWSPYYRTLGELAVPNGRFFTTRVYHVPPRTECRVHNFSLDGLVAISCKDGTRGYDYERDLEMSAWPLSDWIKANRMH